MFNLSHYKPLTALILLVLMGHSTYKANAANSNFTILPSIGIEESSSADKINSLLLDRNDFDLPLMEIHKKNKKQKNMSKKFAPLALKFKVRSTQRFGVRFKVDLMETYDILAKKDASLFLKPDDKHFILSPDTKAEIQKQVRIFKNRFSPNPIMTEKRVSAQLI